MRLALLEKNKLGFVDDSCTKAQSSNNLGNIWERCNAIILSWIGAIVLSNLVSSIVCIRFEESLGRIQGKVR